MKLKFYFDKKPYADQVAVYIIGHDAHGKAFIAAPMQLEFKEMNEAQIQKPTLEFAGIISREFFPALVNGLAESGYKAESNDAGELKATKVHLEDMRTLALRTQQERKDG